MMKSDSEKDKKENLTGLSQYMWKRQNMNVFGII